MWKKLVRTAIVTLLLSTTAGCAALSQQKYEVVTREPGDRMLGPRMDIRPYAVEDLPFAWLANAAYGRSPAGQKAHAELPANACPEPDVVLGTLGWVPWPDFPDPELAATIEPSHLRVEIWYRRDDPAVAVTFGGTVVGNDKDLLANIRWFLPKSFLSEHPDEYTTIVQHVAPKFAEEFQRRLSSPDPEWAFLKKAKLYSTGHSLGGGLAQQFAYSLPPNAPRKVTKVYAFDPSPVTGYLSVSQETRDHNRMGLSIDRIYERGEVLALLRSLTSFIYRPSKENAMIRGIRYSLFYPSTPVGGHSISHLSCELSKVVSGKAFVDLEVR